ncbi:MAG: phosphatidylglycerophosphatase A [Methanocellales archaeon]|nr:phosphatidylglycerophosphatase A [Methanocellales archaeon]
MTKNKNIKDLLESFGASFEKIVSTAMQMYVPHPGVETEEEARMIFRRELEHALSDPNLGVLIYAGATLERNGAKGSVPHPGIDEDLTYLVADEVLGMSIAKYIGGYKGLFEYIRCDKVKPGIVAELGPFMDDVVAGIIGGVSANMYDAGMRAKRMKNE